MTFVFETLGTWRELVTVPEEIVLELEWDIDGILVEEVSQCCRRTPFFGASRQPGFYCSGCECEMPYRGVSVYVETPIDFTHDGIVRLVEEAIFEAGSADPLADTLLASLASDAIIAAGMRLKARIGLNQWMVRPL